MNRLIDLLRTTFSIDFDIDADTPLISSGLIDSLHIVELVSMIGKEYSVSIDAQDIGTDNFDTASQIAEFVELRKKG